MWAWIVPRPWQTVTVTYQKRDPVSKKLFCVILNVIINIELRLRYETCFFKGSVTVWRVGMLMSLFGKLLCLEYYPTSRAS